MRIFLFSRILRNGNKTMNTQTYAGRLTARFYPRLSELFGGCLYSQAPAEVPLLSIMIKIYR